MRGSDGLSKSCVGRAALDDAARAALLGQEERRLLGHPGRLLHVVGDDHDRHLGPELGDRLLDPAGRGRVERRARLVHQQHLGADGQGPGDAQPLLLTAGEGGARAVQAVLDLVPQPGPDQAAPPPGRSARDLADLGVGEGQAGGDVVGDRHGRERVGLLEDHADLLAHVGQPVARRVDVLAVEEHLAGQLGAGHRLVHPVEDPQEGRLAAARRPDEGGHRGRRHRQGDVVEHLGVAEPGRDLDGVQVGRTASEPGPVRRSPPAPGRGPMARRSGAARRTRRRPSSLGPRPIRRWAAFSVSTRRRSRRSRRRRRRRCRRRPPPASSPGRRGWRRCPRSAC